MTITPRQMGDGRAMLKLSLAALADLTGLRADALANYESGDATSLSTVDLTIAEGFFWASRAEPSGETMGYSRWRPLCPQCPKFDDYFLTMLTDLPMLTLSHTHGVKASKHRPSIEPVHVNGGRAALKLSIDALAVLARLKPDDLQRFEGGDVKALSIAERAFLDGVFRAFGVVGRSLTPPGHSFLYLLGARACPCCGAPSPIEPGIALTCEPAEFRAALAMARVTISDIADCFKIELSKLEAFSGGDRAALDRVDLELLSRFFGEQTAVSIWGGRSKTVTYLKRRTRSASRGVA